MTSPSTTPAGDDADQRLATAVETMWQAIRAEHGELPARPPLAERTHRELGGMLRSPLTARYPRRNELREGAEQALAALLHEAAHQLAEARGLAVTSNRGYYHNRAFADLAREVGLDVAEDDPTRAGGGPRGWSRVTVPAATARRYAEALAGLSAALQSYPAPADTPAARRGRNSIVATCACPRRIRIAPTELAKGSIRCGVCDADFTAE
jgi:hypothetical protein